MDHEAPSPVQRLGTSRHGEICPRDPPKGDRGGGLDLDPRAVPRAWNGRAGNLFDRASNRMTRLALAGQDAVGSPSHGRALLTEPRADPGLPTTDATGQPRVNDASHHQARVPHVDASRKTTPS